nr:ribosome maturation factor RimP [uncultured Desulfuromusa sp.]
MAQLLEKIEELVLPILEDLGCELVDIEYQREERGWVLRFFLDKTGGINLDDCAMASREISSLLDVENVISTAYNLEVSSPGVERPLKKPQDFVRFAGQLIRIKTHDAIDPDASGRNRKTFVGTLSGFEDGNVLLELEKNSVVVRIDLQQIDKANLKFEF